METERVPLWLVNKRTEVFFLFRELKYKRNNKIKYYIVIITINGGQIWVRYSSY